MNHDPSSSDKPENAVPANGKQSSGLSSSERQALLAIAKDGSDARGMLVMWLLSRTDGEDIAGTAQRLVDDIEDSEDEYLAGSPLVELLREVASIDVNELASTPRRRKGGRAARLHERKQV